MKKSLKVFTSLLLTLTLLLSLAVVALADSTGTITDEYGNVWEYVEEDDGSITLVALISPGNKNVVIPLKIDGKYVSRLGDGLFEGHDNITSVTISIGIKEIGNDAFKGCSRLETVIIPDTVTAIGDGAFSECPSLSVVTIPDSVVSIGEDVFEGSTDVTVKCNSGSEAAKYIEDHADEVLNYVITDRKSADNYEYSGISGTTSNTQVTFTFGKKIGDTYEYTMVLEDKNPDLDISSHVIYDSYILSYDEEVYNLIKDRFSLVSLVKYDGNTTEDLVKDGISLGYVGLLLTQDNSGIQPGYSVSFYSDTDSSVLSMVMFNASDELTQYTENGVVKHTSSLQKNTGDYTEYAYVYFQTAVKDANGNIIENSSTKQSDTHIIDTTGDKHCYTISYMNSEFTDIDGNKCSSENRDAYIYMGNQNDTITGTSSVIKNSSGKKSSSSSYFCQTKNGNCTKLNTQSILYDNGTVTDIYQTAVVESPNAGTAGETAYNYGYTNLRNYTGSYTLTQPEYTENGSTTAKDEINYSQITVQANDADKAQSVVYNAQYGSQDISGDNANTHKDFISEKNVLISDNISVSGTKTETGSGTESSFTKDIKEEQLEEHIYVNDTGKYVGWDWVWNNIVETVESVKNTINTYVVSQYEYNSDSNVWSKTVVTVDANNTEDKDKNLIESTPATANELSNYYMSAIQYVYDESLSTGAGNWKMISDPVDNGTVSDIALGTSTVKDGSGNELSQSAEKASMVKLASDLETKLTIAKETPNDDSGFELAMQTIEEAHSGISETVSENLTNGSVPETNTADNVDHNHNIDGSITTEITVNDQ